jgi:hypothetical protein
MISAEMDKKATGRSGPAAYIPARRAHRAAPKARRTRRCRRPILPANQPLSWRSAVISGPWAVYLITEPPDYVSSRHGAHRRRAAQGPPRRSAALSAALRALNWTWYGHQNVEKGRINLSGTSSLWNACSSRTGSRVGQINRASVALRQGRPTVGRREQVAAGVEMPADRAERFRDAQRVPGYLEATTNSLGHCWVHVPRLTTSGPWRPASCCMLVAYETRAGRRGIRVLSSWFRGLLRHSGVPLAGRPRPEWIESDALCSVMDCWSTRRARQCWTHPGTMV